MLYATPYKSAHNTPADHVNARCSHHHQRLYTCKKAGFSQHERSQCHREAVERSITLHVTTTDAGEHISSAREEDKANNKNAILKMLSNIRFLGRRGIPLRGDGDGNNSNFTQIVHLQTKYISALSTWSRKPTSTPPGRCKTIC